MKFNLTRVRQVELFSNEFREHAEQARPLGYGPIFVRFRGIADKVSYENDDEHWM